MPMMKSRGIVKSDDEVAENWYLIISEEPVIILEPSKKYLLRYPRNPKATIHRGFFVASNRVPNRFEGKK